MTHEEVHCSPKELLVFANLYKQKPWDYVWEWILKMWNNSQRSIKLDHNEFIDMGPLSRGSTFNVTAQRIIKGSNNLVGCLVAWLDGLNMD